MTGQMIAFPTSRHRVQVLRAAHTLAELNGEAANVAWKSLVSTMSEELLANGVSAADMRRQILEFQAVVQLELRALFEKKFAPAPA